MDDNFEKWLELATDLADKTIKSYIGALKKINFDLAEQNIIQMSLEEINSGEELEKIKIDYLELRNIKNLKISKTKNNSRLFIA